MSWKDIPGFCDFYEIYDRALEEARPGDIFVEVGVMLGHSLCYLAHQARELGKEIEIYGVDPWGRTDGWGVHTTTRAFTVALQTMLTHSALEIDAIHLLRLPSVRAAWVFDDGECAFVFIDGDHSEEAVRADLRAWAPKVRSGGVIAGHDYDAGPVARAVDSYFDSPVERVKPAGAYNECWRVRAT
jgi:cephalosporin hydroxylase